MRYKAILIPILCFALLYSQGAFTAKADDSADYLAALSPYNVFVEAAYGGEKVKLAGLVIQRDIIPGYNKDTDSTKFYILISLSRIPDCFLPKYSFTVWQDKYDKDKRAQLGAQYVSATLLFANAKANIGILRCDSLPHLKADGFTIKQYEPGTIDKEALNNKRSFVLTPPTLIDNEKKFSYAGKSANAKGGFSIGSSVFLRGNTAYEIKGLDPLITGDASFAAGVPLFYPDDNAALKYSLAGLINFERYAPDVRLDNGQLYSSTAYYYPVEYIRRAIDRALPPSPKLDLPAHYKGMRASGAKVTTPSEGDTDKLQIDDDITAIDGVPSKDWGVSASLYIALNYSGGNKLLLIKYNRPNVKGEQKIAEAVLQSSNSLWFGADAVPLPPKLKDEHYKNSDYGFYVRLIEEGRKSIAVNDLIRIGETDKVKGRFDGKFHQCCPRLDMWLWDNFTANQQISVNYFSVKDRNNLSISNVTLKEWTNYHDTFSREPKSGGTSTNSTDFSAAITAAQNAIKDLNAAIAKVTGTPPAESDLGKALMSAKDLKAKLQGYLNALNSTTATQEQKTQAQAEVITDISKVKDCIEALEKARVAYKPADTTTTTTEQPENTQPPPDYKNAIKNAEAAIGQLRTAISGNEPKPKDVGYPLEGPLAEAKREAETLISTLQEIAAILKGEKDGDKESENKRLTDQIAKVSTCISELENAKKAYDQDKAKTAAETSIGKLGAAIAKVTETPPADSELGKALQDAKDLKAKLEGYLSTLNSNDATDAKKTEAQEGIEEEVKEENGISKVSECVNKLANAKAAYDISTELINIKNSANTAIAEARKAANAANGAAEPKANADLIAQAKQYNLEGSTEYKTLDREISAAKSAANNATDKAKELEKLIATLTTENYAEKKVSVDSILANLYTLTTKANTACENISKARDALQSALNRKLQSDLKGRAQVAVDAVRTAAKAAKDLAEDNKHLLVDAKDLGLAEVVYKPLEDAIEKAKAAAATAEGKATDLDKLINDSKTNFNNYQTRSNIEKLIAELYDDKAQKGLRKDAESAVDNLTSCAEALIGKLVEALKAKADATVKSAKEAANKAKISASATELSTLQQEAKQLDVNHKGLEDAISATKNAADQLDNRANALLTLLNELGPGTYESKKEEIRDAITGLQTAQDELDTKAITAAAEALQAEIDSKNKENAVAELSKRIEAALKAVQDKNSNADTALADADAILEAARAMKLDTVSVFADLKNARKNADDAKQTAQNKAKFLEEQRDALTKDNYEDKKTQVEGLIAELTSEDGLNSITANSTAKVREQASKMFELLKEKAQGQKVKAEQVRENASDAKEKLFVSLAKLRADDSSAPVFGIDAAKADVYTNLLEDIKKKVKELKLYLPDLPTATITDATKQNELTTKFEKTVKPALDALSAISKAIEDSQLLLREGWLNSLTEVNATNAKAIQTAFTAFESLPSLTETAKKAAINPGDTMWFIIAITFISLFVVLAAVAIYLLNKSEKEKKNTEAEFESYKKSYEKNIKDTNRVASLEESVSWLKAQLQQNNDKIVGLNDTITKRETEIQELQKKIDDLSKNPPVPIDPDTQNEIESLKAEIARLEEELRRRGTYPPVPIPPTAQLTSGQIRLLKAVARFDSGSKQKLTEDCHINIESLHEIDKYINAIFVQQTIGELNKLNNIHGIYGSDRDKAIGHYTAKNAKMIKIPVSLLHKIAKGEGVFSPCKTEIRDDSKSVSQAIVVTAPQISAEQIQPTAEPLQNGNLTFAALMLTPAATNARLLLKALHEACAKLESPQGESAIHMPVGEIANAGLSSSDLSDAIDFINSELPKCSDIITSSNKLITISNDKTVIYVYLSITNILYSNEHESIIKQTNQTNGLNQ